MTKEQVKSTPNGLYTVYWKGGGSSLASIGTTPTGKKWIAPVNWVSGSTSKRRVWKRISFTVVIPHH